MADANIQLPSDGAGKKLAAQTVTRGADTVYREEIVIADPDSESEVASVSAANGLEVDVTRVQGSVAVLAEESATGTTTSVADSNTNQTLLASNTSRLGFSIFNDSTEVLYVKMGATATTSDYGVRLSPGGYYEDAVRYTGRVDGIWAANGSGAAKITEYT